MFYLLSDCRVIPNAWPTAFSTSKSYLLIYSHVGKGLPTYCISRTVAHVGKGLPTYCVTRTVGRQPFAANDCVTRTVGRQPFAANDCVTRTVGRQPLAANDFKT